MTLAGRFPIVRGATTLQQFIQRVQIQPRPDGGFNFGNWLRSSGLNSSYFRDDIRPFAAFIGLIDDKGATELWADLRDTEKSGEALVSALRAAYAGPLDFLGISIPDASDVGRIANWIRNNENTSATQADQAAETAISAFDLALGREPAVAATEASRRTATRPATVTARTPRNPRATTRTEPTPRNLTRQTTQEGLTATLAVNLQIVLPSDASDDRYDAMMGAVAKHLATLLRQS